MRIFTEQTLKEYIGNHPDARVALQEWVSIVKRSEWTCFADIRQTFGTVDAVGNQHFVFNIKGNRYRLVVVIKFTIRFVYIRFIGTQGKKKKEKIKKRRRRKRRRNKKEGARKGSGNASPCGGRRRPEKDSARNEMEILSTNFCEKSEEQFSIGEPFFGEILKMGM